MFDCDLCIYLEAKHICIEKGTYTDLNNNNKL